VGSTAVLVVQVVTFPYNLIPLSMFLALYAAVGLREVARALGGERRSLSRRIVAVALSTLVTGHFILGAARAWLAGNDTNAYQLDELGRIVELTAPGDAVYDNTGGFVVRPHAYFFYKTDAFMRRALAQRLRDEVPAAIIDSSAKAMLMDTRFDGLPPQLRTFLLANFQPYDNDIWLWGRRYDAPDGTLEGKFFAIETGRYFVPASPPGALRVGGRVVGADPFELERGLHALSYRGERASFHVLWLPRNGERYIPRQAVSPRFSRVM
jgi:hypothetical protein